MIKHLSLAAVVVVIVSRNTACREMYPRSEGTVIGGHRADSSEWGRVGMTLTAVQRKPLTPQSQQHIDLTCFPASHPSPNQRTLCYIFII